MEELKCTIERIRYYNTDTGFAVVRVGTGEWDGKTATGIFPDIHEGMSFLMTGEWVEHPSYGAQFKCTSAVEVLPGTKKGMESYLGSGMVKGIGPKYAEAIVKKFGEDTFDVISRCPEKLLSVPGIGKGRLAKIIAGWEEQAEVRNIMMYLQSAGISTAYAVKIYKKFGNRSVERVRKNPYCLTQIWGIGFKIADGIAQNMGFALESPERCRSGLLYAMEQLGKCGHVYADRESLVRFASSSSILALEDEAPVQSALESLLGTGMLVCEAQYPCAVYLPKYLSAERYVAQKVLQLAQLGKGSIKQPPLSNDDIKEIEQKLGVQYDECQRLAICTAAESRLMILTGGPGTGKTTTVNGILECCWRRKKRVLLAAPTGRAAKRMSEVTGVEALTIHRLLEYGQGGLFARNKENPLCGDVLVVDESSMIDILLMESLLSAVPERMSVIFTGDVDQLPSVGPGSVLKDMIESKAVSVVRLTKIFRQAQTSDIVMNAHRINHGQIPVVTNSADSDFFWCGKPDPQSVQDTIVDYVSEKLPRYYHIRPTEIQVLAPMRKGAEGTEALNKRLQEAVNPVAEGIPFKNGQLRIGDKVMQLKNNYDKDVFNGDVGFVNGFNKEEKTTVVDFGGSLVTYERGDLDELTLAYACTVHKSQGSEYPVVVMPVSTSHAVMLQRNLLYTGITRAKKVFVAVGSVKALNMAVSRVDSSKRNTLLAKRLAEGLICM